jgi:hypothetical protein
MIGHPWSPPKGVACRSRQYQPENGGDSTPECSICGYSLSYMENKSMHGVSFLLQRNIIFYPAFYQQYPETLHRISVGRNLRG